MNTTKKKSQKTNVVVEWLKKIFSIQTLVLLFTATGVLIAYLAFVKDKPGKLSLYTSKQAFSSQIQYIIYGFEINGDSILINKQSNFPKLANTQSNPVDDFSILCKTKNNIGFRVCDGYKYYIEKADSVQPGDIMLGSEVDRIGIGRSVIFPIDALETEDNEILMQYFNLAYMYKGMPKDIMNLHYYLVGIPKHYRDADGKEYCSEYIFIKAIRPLLLNFRKISKKILIVFDDKVVEAPKNINLLNREELKIQSITELQ